MVDMKTAGKIALAVVVLGAACMWAMFNGHWAAVVSFTQAAFGVEVSETVDEFGNTSKEIGDGVIDYGSTIAKQLESGEAVTPDWGGIGETLGGLGKPNAARHPDYDRDEFGAGWLDTDGNGCDTRNDILARDLTQVKRADDRCTVLTGTLHDSYTEKTISFVRGAATSAAVQIDHIVPLSLAWRNGAWSWSDEKREAFANDPINLLAVDGPTNGSKSDKSISEWLPPKVGAHCTYVAMYVSVHEKYDLAMSDADKKATRKLIDACK